MQSQTTNLAAEP